MKKPTKKNKAQFFLSYFKKPYFIMLFVIIIWANHRCFSQMAQWKSINTADGLGDVKVNVIFETNKEGDLWFGTRYGATRFDGLWKNFIQADGLVHNEVFAIAEDDSGYLWLGTEQGMSRFKDDHFYPGPDTVASHKINSIFKDNEGKIWIATLNGACCFNPENYLAPAQQYSTENGLPANDIRDILVDKDQRVWFGTAEHGVARLNTNGSWTYFTTSENTDGKLKVNYIRDIFEDNQGKIWIATWGGGVTQFDEVNMKWYSIDLYTIYKKVYAIAQDWDNNYWFATEKNVFRYDGTIPSEQYTTKDGLASEVVLDVLEDSYGNMWFATRGAGVSRYDGTWRSFLLDKGELWTIAKDNHDNLWFAFIDSGLYYYDKKTREFKSLHVKLESKLVTSILRASDGTMWVGTIDAGVTAIGETDSKTIKTSKIAENYIRCIEEDEEQQLWFGTNSGGVSRYDPLADTSITFNISNSKLLNNRIHDIHQDIYNNMWFATPTGISRYNYNNNQWTSFTRDEYPFNSDYMLCIAEDGENNLWFGTSGGGVLFHPVSDDSNWRIYDTQDGLVNNTVNSILYDDYKDRLWFGTQNGMSRLSNGRWYNLTETETGMSNDWIKCIFLDKIYRVHNDISDTTITLWFGTAEGAQRYVGESIPPTTIILSPRPDTTFGIASPFFNVSARDNVSLPEDISYSYQIWNINSAGTKSLYYDWSSFSFNNLIVVEQPLPNGHFEILVRAQDSDKNLDKSPASLTFFIDVVPPTVAIFSPKDDQYVSGDVAIVGIVRDKDLADFKIEYSLRNSDDWISDPDILSYSHLDLPWGFIGAPETLATWHTDRLAAQPATYQLRLAAKDDLNHVSSTEIEVFVDQVSTLADIGDQGGFIITPGREVELFIPPKALSKICKIHISSLDSLDQDYLLLNNRSLVGYRVSLIDKNGQIIEAQSTLLDGKLGVITIRHPDIIEKSGSEKHLTIFHRPDGTKISRLGGTPDFIQHKITAPFKSFGKFIVIDTVETIGDSPMEALTCQPRVFSTTNPNLPSYTSIIFTLKKSTTITVYVYNTAARLIRKLVTEQPFYSGENVISWDGLDEEGKPCHSGLYVICAHFDGNKQLKTVVIANQ